MKAAKVSKPRISANYSNMLHFTATNPASDPCFQKVKVEVTAFKKGTGVELEFVDANRSPHSGLRVIVDPKRDSIGYMVYSITQVGGIGNNWDESVIGLANTLIAWSKTIKR